MRPPLNFQQDKLLSEISTFGIGGTARLFLEVRTIEEMQLVISHCYKEKLPYIVIGKGSNCLFDDRGFDGLCILNKITFCEFQEKKITAGSGYSFSLLGVQTARKGLLGLEFASGIPASVGGAVYMNAGANGSDTSSCLTEVMYLRENGEIEMFSKDNIEFGYRFSSFQKMKGAILAATFTLLECSEARFKQIQIVDYRKKTQPYTEKSAGCVFRNPLNGSAGQLIDQAGLKGVKIGGAEVSSMHANFILNRDQATAEDVLKLVDHIQKVIREKTGVELEMEIRCIPYRFKDVQS